MIASTLSKAFEDETKLLLDSIELKYNYDFRNYTPASMKRLLVQAMDRMGCETLSVLREKVLRDLDCFQDLIQSLTVSVSEMFRDPTYYLALREQVIPRLKTYPSIRVWVAGCSTGEEAFSLAILLAEEQLLERTTLYATDINSHSLDKAKKGVLRLAVIEKFTENYQKSGGMRLLAEFCSVADGSVKINGDLMRHITFTDHSLATDAVFSEMHLISCRNVLIYFDRKLQERAFGLFHDSLCRKGFLGLGAKETIQFSAYAKNFDRVVKRDRIFQKV